MRKDLKIGMAIGALLLVVLIVYIAVPKNPTDVAQNGDAVELQSDGGEGGNGAVPEESTSPTGTGTPAERSVAGSDTGASDRTTDVFSPESDAQPTAGETAAAGQTNWDLLLTTGQIPSKTVTPSLRATNTVAPTTPAPAAPAGTGAPAAPAAPEVTTAADGTPTGTTGTATDDAPDTGAAQPGGEQSDSTTPSDETPTAEATSPAPAAGRSHTVKSGETFSSIAKAAYNDERQYLAIEAANPTVNPKRLRPGTVIALPDLAAAQTASAKIGGDSPTTETAARTTKAFDPKNEYKVRSGDSLYKIAVSVYGSSNMVDDLYEANRQAIGADSSKLKLGTVLKLPPNPNAQASTR